MTKILFKTLLVSVSAAIIAATSCTKDANEPNIIKKEDKLLTLKSFERYGQLHNEVLTKVKNDYVMPEEITNYNEAINHINYFVKKSLLESNLVTEKEKTIFANTTFSDKHKHFVDNRVFATQLVKYNSELTDTDTQFKLMSALNNENHAGYFDSVDFNICEKLDSALILGLVDTFEYDNLKLIIYKSCENMLGQISEDDLYDCILDIAAKWESRKYTEDGKFGKVIGSTLAIGIASYDWWQQNPDARYTEGAGDEMVLQLGVAGDIGGAAVGAVLGGISGLIFGGDFWDSVAGGALGGAIDGSTGATSKVAKWLKQAWDWIF